MAEEALKKLEEQVNCSICLDTFTDPKLLQCFHVFCRQCLVPLGVRDQQGLTCPTCRQVTPIPDRGVAGLQSAFHINNLLEIQDSFKQIPNPLAELAGAAVESTATISRNVVPRCCYEHASQELKLYCETCGELVCVQCIIQNGKHHDHDCKLLHKAFSKYQEEITSSLEPMENKVVIVKEALAVIKQRCGEISDQQAAIKDKVHATFEQLREILTVREAEIIDQLHQRTQGKLKNLAAQSDQIETILAQLDSCLHFMKESIKPGNESDVLMMKSNTVHQVRELITPISIDIVEPNTEADTTFSALADMTEICQNYSQVIPLTNPDPSQCHTIGKGDVVVGQRFTTTVQAINYEGKPCVEPIKSLECELTSEMTGTRAICSVKRRQSQYEISYKPTIKGRHQLHIKAYGQHIRGSPFSVAVTSPVEKVGTPIHIIDEVNRPNCVAINLKGELVVTEENEHCVSVLSYRGEKLRSFGTFGSGKGQFNSPRGVTVDNEGNILVADCLNSRIQKFTAEGQFITAMTIKSFLINHPSDIAFNTRDNKLYVADLFYNYVQVLNSDLTSSSIFYTDENFSETSLYVTCDHTGKVYVTDSDKKCIQVFTAGGKFVRMFGRRGWLPGTGKLNNPSHIAVDTSGMVYVSDSCQVVIFSSEGQFVTSFKSREKLTRNSGIAVDNNGVVYVCDSDNNCIRVF